MFIEWWNALSLATQVFYCIARPSTLILLIQTILLFVGIGGDGDVDVDDCIYLVYSVFFGTTDYPVYQDLDFDGDGVVGSEDGVYLLRYIYYGACEYPLH